MGAVGSPQAVLSDGNRAGTGDLVRARLNTEIDADGRKLTNRDTLKIAGWRGPDAEVRRQRQDGTWTGPFRVPRSYLAPTPSLPTAATSTSPRAAPSTPRTYPEPWLTRHLGAPPGPDASPVLREDYAWRAGTAAAYREAQGITDPDLAVSFSPHPGPELEILRNDTIRALEIVDEQAEIRAMSRGDLEAQVHDGDRAQATAPPDMSSQLRVTAQAAADAWQQSADAKVEHDQEQAENARSLAAALAVQMNRLEAADERFEEWSARTASTREIAGKAKAELQRRGQQPPGREAPGPQSMTAWWREFQADVDAVDRAIDREHQAAVYDSQPWPPERKPEAGREEPYACAPGQPQPEAAGPNPADDGRAARLDELQARADQAARRIDAQRAELDASSQHTARVEREAQAGPAAGQQAETSYDMEMEL
jgi:hypothetical protein